MNQMQVVEFHSKCCSFKSPPPKKKIFLCGVNFNFMNIDCNVSAFNTEAGMRRIFSAIAVPFLLKL